MWLQNVLQFAVRDTRTPGILCSFNNHNTHKFVSLSPPPRSLHPTPINPQARAAYKLQENNAEARLVHELVLKRWVVHKGHSESTPRACASPSAEAKQPELAVKLRRQWSMHALRVVLITQAHSDGTPECKMHSQHKVRVRCRGWCVPTCLHDYDACTANNTGAHCVPRAEHNTQHTQVTMECG